MSALLEYKCPCCGGAIEFNSSTQNMKCPYCDTEFEVNTIKEYNDALREDRADVLEWEADSAEWSEAEQQGMNVYTCSSCGGQIITDSTTAASACPYCDNPIVMTGQLEGGLRPDLVIPFKIDKKSAEEALQRHLKGKFLLPKSFTAENRIEEIKGVYVPFWLFDCDADAHIRYKTTRVRSWSSGNYRYTETTHYLVLRDGEISFNKVPVDGSTKMPDDLSESVEPFDYNACVDFESAYLAGFLADKYDVGIDQSAQRANQRIRASTEEEFRKTVAGYSSVIQESSSIHLKHGESRYALLPVWILSTNYRGEIYRFAMNGQTGKFVGNLPTDWGKFWGLFAGIFAGVTALIYIVSTLH